MEQYDVELTVTVTPVLDGYDPSTGDGTSAAATVVAGSFTGAAVIDVTGTPTVGQQLTAEVTTAAQPSPTSYSYQWYADGTAITDATDATFTPGVGQYDVELTVTVTPVLDGYDPSTGADLSCRDRGGGIFTGAAVIDVTGTPTVGQQLTAEVTTAAQPSPTSYSYQWYADGTAITDATDATFTPAGEQYDAELTVTVTPVLTGYASSTGDDTSAGVTVEEGAFTGSVDVSIVGLAQVGKTVTAVVTGALAPSPALAYAWYADSMESLAAPSTRSTIPTRAAGATLTVQVTASLLGYGDVTALFDGCRRARHRPARRRCRWPTSPWAPRSSSRARGSTTPVTSPSPCTPPRAARHPPPGDRRHRVRHVRHSAAPRPASTMWFSPPPTEPLSPAWN